MHVEFRAVGWILKSSINQQASRACCSSAVNDACCSEYGDKRAKSLWEGSRCLRSLVNISDPASYSAVILITGPVGSLPEKVTLNIICKFLRKLSDRRAGDPKLLIAEEHDQRPPGIW